MTCGKNSLPTPLSPVTRTVRSVGATRTATSSARSKSSEVPMMPKRCLTVVMSVIYSVMGCSGRRRARVRCGLRVGGLFEVLHFGLLVVRFTQIAERDGGDGDGGGDGGDPNETVGTAPARRPVDIGVGGGSLRRLAVAQAPHRRVGVHFGRGRHARLGIRQLRGLLPHRGSLRPGRNRGGTGQLRPQRTAQAAARRRRRSSRWGQDATPRSRRAGTPARAGRHGAPRRRSGRSRPQPPVHRRPPLAAGRAAHRRRV